MMRDRWMQKKRARAERSDAGFVTSVALLAAARSH